MVEHRTERRAAAVADPVLHEVELDNARAGERWGQGKGEGGVRDEVEGKGEG